MSQYREYQQSQQLGEAEERALDIIDDIVAREGEFINKEQSSEFIRAYANVVLPEMAQKHGFGPLAAQAALEQSAKVYRALEQSIGESAINSHLNQLKTLSGVPSEPGSSYAQGTQQHVTIDHRGGGSLFDRMAAR
jgi:hypothetical protein